MYFSPDKSHVRLQAILIVDIVPMAQLFPLRVLLPATATGLVDVLSMEMFKTNDNVIHASGIY